MAWKSCKIVYASFWQNNPKTVAGYYKSTLAGQLCGADLGLGWHPVAFVICFTICISHTWSEWKVNKDINTFTVGCVLFINNFWALLSSGIFSLK